MNNSVKKPILEQRTLVGLRVVFIYLIVGMLWIFFSDSVLSFLVRDSQLFAQISIYKGLLFVIATSLLILLLVRQAMESSSNSEKQLQARSNQLETVVELGRDALSGTGPGELVDAAVTSVVSQLGVDLCEVLEMLPGRGDLIVKAGSGWTQRAGQEAAARSSPTDMQNIHVSAEPDTLAGNVLQARTPVVFQDLHSETRFRPPAHLTTENVVSGMSVRIQGKDRPYGILSVYSRTPRAFITDDANFLQMTATVLGTAIARVQTDEQLRGQFNFTNAISNSVADGLYVIDSDGQLSFLNPAAEQMLGWTETELLGKDIQKSIHCRYGDGIARNGEGPALDLSSTGRAVAGVSEDVYTRKDGSLMPVMYASSPIVLDGQVRGVVVAFHDITERKHSQESLRESEQRFRAVFHAALDAIFISDEHGCCTDANPAAFTLLGLDRQELIGKRLTDYGLLADEALSSQQTMPNGQHLQGEVQLVRADGQTREVSYRARPHFFGSHTLIVAEDITERKAHERQLQEYGETQADLLNQVMHAQETERRRLSMEIHDGPLQSLAVGITDVDRALRRHLRGESDRAEQEIRNLRATLVTAVAEVRSILADLSLEVLSRYGLEAAVSSYVERFPETENIEVTVENSVPYRLPYNVELLMYRLAQEALANVRKHSYATHASVSLRQEGDQVLMSITDNGRGFDPNSIEEQSPVGFQLGLRSMRQRISDARGEMRIASAEGQGTTLEFRCPLPG